MSESTTEDQDQTQTQTQAQAQAPFEIGDLVADREPADGNANTAVVVNCPPQQADEWNAYGDTTVAEDNPDHPEDAPVAIIIYRSQLKRFDPEWTDREYPYPLTAFNEAGISYYSFPTSRLKPLDSDSDPDAEGATETTESGEQDTAAQSDDGPRMAQVTHENTTTTSPPVEETKPEATDDLEPDADEPDDQASEPTDAALQLRDRLEDGGMTVEIEADGRTLAAEKLGETYRVQPGGDVVEGDGLFAQKLASIAADFEPKP
jgi:hypothetical protein